MNQSEAAVAVGFAGFVTDIIPQGLRRVGRFDFSPEPGNVADFNKGRGIRGSKFSIRKDYEASDVLHESIHAYNHHILGFNWERDDEKDEVLAYLGESHLSFFRIELGLEKLVKAPDVCNKQALLKREWIILWKRFDKVERWASYQFNFGAPSRSSTERDFALFNGTYGLRQVNCGLVADILNEKLQESGCCFRFSCELGNHPERDISPMYPIDPFLK